MATYLVTGAAGFVGSNIIERMLEGKGPIEDDAEIAAIDNLSTGKRENVERFRGHPRVEFREIDIRDEKAIEPVVERADYVLHQAAIPSVPRSLDDPVATTDTNCLGTTNLLTAAEEAGVEKAVVASSSSVYGPSESLPKREEMPANPVSPYALSKYWTEQLAIQFSDYFDIDAIALRYFNIFGPHQDAQSEYAAVIPAFIERMLDGKRPEIYGDGEQSRDFTYIDNVVDANLKALASDCTGEAMNVACGDQITLNELVAQLNEILGTDIDPKHTDPRPGDVRHSKADISKAKERIGYEPSVSFRDGLERTVAHFREARPAQS